MAILAALQQSTAVSGRGLALEDAFRAKDITTPAMTSAIKAWFELYYARERTKDADPSQRIPYIVVNKLTRTVFSEYEAQSENVFAQEVLEALEPVRKKGMQRGLIGGEALLKPIFTDGKIQFSVIDRQGYLVFGRNEMGELTDTGTSELTATGGYFYTLLERRAVDERGFLTIWSRLYRSQGRESLGSPVPLSTLPKYAQLQEEVTLPTPVGSVGLIPIRTPMENCVDGSDDSVSVFEPAIGLIRLIAINEAQITGEFERGESRIVVSSDLMRVDEDGKRSFDDHIYSGLDHDPDSVGVTIFSPEFREQSFLARKLEYLRNVESLIGLKRGILSEVEAAERTATEVTSSAGDYNLTIIDFQQAWEKSAREAVRVCGILGKLYGVSGATEVRDEDVVIAWGNGILYDEDKVWEQYRDMVARGMLRPEIAVAWYFDLPWETDADIEAIRARYMPTIEGLMDADA